MDINIVYQQIIAIGKFGIDLTYWVDFGSGFVLGVLASYLGNYFWEKHKKKKRGDAPYCMSSVTGDSINVEAQIPNTTTNQNVVTKIIKATTPQDS